MSPNPVTRILATGLALVLFFGLSVSGDSISELERLAGLDFIPEIREAASRALVEKYIQEGVTADRLEETANTARTAELREAATRALAKQLQDPKDLNSLAEAEKKFFQLKVKAGGDDSPALSKAASKALGLYYLTFNLAGREGFSLEELESLAKGSDRPGLAKPAAEALETIYPNYFSENQLKRIIRGTTSSLIRDAASKALAIRYYTVLPPEVTLEELKEKALNEKEDPWIRAAAGEAFGNLAKDLIPEEELEDLTLTGSTEEIRRGAAKAWSKHLVESDKGKFDFIKMAVAATGYAPYPYRSAIIEALSARLSEDPQLLLGG